MDDKTIDKLIEMIMQKMEEKSNIKKLAYQIFNRIQEINKDEYDKLPFVGIEEIRGKCGPEYKDRQWDCGKVEFICSEKDPYKCNDNIIHFECKGGEQPDGTFYCQVFECNNSDSYTCKNPLSDFNCDNIVQCKTNFECGGRHVYSCNNETSCNVQFRCKTYDVLPCIGEVCYFADGGKDRVPGDFFCGWHEPEPDEFNCLNLFSCETADDFRCRTSTSFSCFNWGQAAFDCRSHFQCAGSLFACNINFSCRGSVFQCAQPIPFTCIEGNLFSCSPCHLYKNEPW